MDTGFIQIQVNEFSGGWTAWAMPIGYKAYLYLRRNFRHYHYSTERGEIVVMSNVDITSDQAFRVVQQYIRGYFKIEDTADWD